MRSFVAEVVSILALPALRLAPAVLFAAVGSTGFAGAIALSPSSALIAPGDSITITEQASFSAADVAGGFNLGGFSLALFYDASRFTLSNVQLGSLTSAGFAGGMSANLGVSGQLTVAATATNPLTGISVGAGSVGDLLTFTLTARSDAPAGSGDLNIVPTIGIVDTSVVMIDPVSFEGRTVDLGNSVTPNFDVGVDSRITVSSGVSAVPEPSSLVLGGVAVVCATAARRRVRRL